MSLYGQIVRHALYPLDRWRSGDADELRYLREFEQTQFWSPEKLRELQWQRLQAIACHAYEQIPFYRCQFDAAGLSPADLRSLDDWHKFPILEKRHLQQERDDMVARNWPTRDLILDRTGGSTGSPVSYYLSRQRHCSRIAAAWRHDRWAGHNMGERIALVWGASRDVPPSSFKQRLRNVLIDRNLYLDAGEITEASLHRFQTSLRRFRPRTILAYARTLGLLARYLKERGIGVSQPRGIITSAEVLEASDRQLIEEVFGCPVFNRYGCREVGVIASECAQHQGLHIMAEGLLVEVIAGDRPAQPGEPGAIVVTDLLNQAMPLLRYRIGDMGAIESGTCGCGRGLPRLSGVQGRVTDFITGSDGRLVSGVFLATYVVAKRPSLGQVQIWQDRPGQVLYKVCAPQNKIAEEDAAFLIAETRAYVGADTEVGFEVVPQIPLEASGKYLFCKSKVAPRTHAAQGSTAGKGA